MFIYYYPLWDLSFWYNLSFDHSQLDAIMLELYQKTISTKVNNISDEDEQMKFVTNNRRVIVKDITSINDFYDDGKFYDLPVSVDSIVKSYKVGFLIDPLIRIHYQQKHNSKFNNNTDPFEFVKWLNEDYKNRVWTGVTQDRPQWYFYSNSTNECIMNLLVSLVYDSTNSKFILNNLGVLIDYISTKESSAKDKLNQIHNIISGDLNKLENKLKDLYTGSSGIYYNVHKLYQNDYYFFDELEYELNVNYRDDNISLLRETHKKLYRQNAFTIITPTVGSANLFKLKQVLKQEKLNYIHIILWDTNRKPMEYNGKELTPEDFEDECTYCYEFEHPYYEFPKQRNDVWLRGVGCTLTNTPYITFHDDDTWPERNHLDDVMRYMNYNHLDYTYVARRMWADEKTPIGKDDFEATGEVNKFGYRLVDNSSLYLNIDTARILAIMFLSNQIYGDDRLTYDHLTDNKKNGKRYDKILVNHIAKEHLIGFFKANILGTV